MITQERLISQEERALTLFAAVLFAVMGVFLLGLALSMALPAGAILFASIPFFIALAFALGLSIDWWAGRPERQEQAGRTNLARELDAYVAEGSVPAEVVSSFTDSPLPTDRKRDIAAWLAEGRLTVDDALELLTTSRTVALSRINAAARVHGALPPDAHG